MSSPTMLRRAGGAVLSGALRGPVSELTRWSRSHLDLLLSISVGLLVLLAAVPSDVSSQQRLGLALVVSMLILGRIPRASTIPVTRILFLSAGAFLTLRYFFWRTAHTVVFHDVVSFTVSILLYAAELYGIVLYLVSLIINARTLDRSEASLEVTGREEDWPTVDIMVPSYNEDPKLLEVTLLAAVAMDYPKGLVEVHLLDDGGTLQKRTPDRPEDGSRPTEDAIARAKEASQRHIELQKLCDRVGCTYRTRRINNHAKAGNINAALFPPDGPVDDLYEHPYSAPPLTNRELILILDADHVPTPDFLKRTVGAFQRDPELFLLQTPHFFINPDPIEKNLDTFRTMPSENEMFYAAIQRGLDFWNSSFFCGSAALLRRTFLEDNDGVSGHSITEDAETALALHNKGYRSAYFD
ncbi:MAG: glycosyltransferase, partial [Acidobacteriota bacterium]